ncbi:MAG: Xaa-Pro peptidase family protein [Desulfobacterales bacterium]|nr:Xaa-Pro peptidase family protein [Desulfobacterales bacterium]
MNHLISERISRLRNRMLEQNLDAFLVLFQESRYYLSGFTGEDTQFDESAGALIIGHDALILATDSRYEIQAKNEATGYEIVCYKKGLAGELPSILQQLKPKRLGFESRRISLDLYNKINKEIVTVNPSPELVPVSDMADGLRLIKDETEIHAIKESIRLAESAFEKTLQWLTPGVSERSAAWELEKNMRSAGAQSVSFPVIAAFGKNSALPHAIPGEAILKINEPILFDWGARLSGYCSDTTRTFVFDKPDARFENIFTIVRDAQQKAIDAIRPGMRTKQIDDIARSHIDSKGFKNFFGHGLGHGVGLAIHESPSISPFVERDMEIKENMVFTVEPGIYLPDWGGVRLENMVRVTEDGVEVLNRLETKMQW